MEELGIFHLDCTTNTQYIEYACWLVILFTGVSLKATDSFTKKQATRFNISSPVCGKVWILEESVASASPTILHLFISIGLFYCE